MVDDSLLSQLRGLSMSKSYKKKLGMISEQPVSFRRYVDIDPVGLLGAILLIEMHQRPGPIRALEWIASLLVPKTLRGSITRGPLQIADGPWRLEDAVARAVRELDLAFSGGESQESAVVCAAVCWNGAATRQPGSQYGYADVLREAYPIAQKALAKLRAVS